MKKFLLILTVAALSFGSVDAAPKKATAKKNTKTEQAAAAKAQAEADSLAAKAKADSLALLNAAPAVESETEIAGSPIHKMFLQKFLEGDWVWMILPLLCLILGLAISVQRILYLTFSTINTKRFVKSVEGALNEGGVEAAKEVCRTTRGPIASIYYQGLDRYDQGLDAIEKSVVSYGSVQTGRLESGLSWLGLFIALAPMLGFMGTVWGLIMAFDAIQAAGDISPALVAGGMKVALLTTLMGLISAIVLQTLYNYIISKIDSIVNEMEDSSIILMDILTAYNRKK